MKKEEFLELLEAELSKCPVDAEKLTSYLEYSIQAAKDLDDEAFSQCSADTVRDLAVAVSENGEASIDVFFARDEEVSLEEGVFEPDQFFYEFASIEDEPELIQPIFDDEVVGGTRTFNTADVENDVYINNRKLNRVDKLRGRKNIDKSAKNTPLFWILFILTLPITIPIFALIWAFIGVLYAAVSAVIAVLVAVVVAVVGIGTALALVGLIFGIIKCFSVLPIGLYEVGLAIVITGITMLVSLLVYNLAVRLVPRLYSLLSRLSGWVWYNIRKFYYFCKKECDRK